MMAFLCECNGPCRKAIDISPDVYRMLRAKGGTVLTPGCAVREGRHVLYRHGDVAVVALSTFPPVFLHDRALRPTRSLHSRQ